jgi:hypothetical protein
MSASDNELEQYLNEFKRYTYSIGAATARVARVRVRTHLFWESNPKSWCTNSYKLSHLFTGYTFQILISLEWLRLNLGKESQARLADDADFIIMLLNISRRWK